MNALLVHWITPAIMSTFGTIQLPALMTGQDFVECDKWEDKPTAIVNRWCWLAQESERALQGQWETDNDGTVRYQWPWLSQSRLWLTVNLWHSPTATDKTQKLLSLLQHDKFTFDCLLTQHIMQHLEGGRETTQTASPVLITVHWMQ